MNSESTHRTHDQVYNHLRNQIVDEVVTAGEQLPSVQVLADAWDVQESVASSALAALVREGFALEAPSGAGAVVANFSTQHTAHDHVRSSRMSGRIYPVGEYARILEADKVPAPTHVVLALGLDAGADVIRRQRVTMSRSLDAPVSTSTSWFHVTVAETSPALLSTERIPEGTPAYLERTSGRRVVSGREQIAADRAGQFDGDLLGVEADAPVKRTRTWLFDAKGDVVEFGESVSLDGRWSTSSFTVDRGQEG
ncbi:GntR family transcriptional regulator [Salininema proteolyticum]|uniref:GntR family transcriptional regulator n=1 Tax=Salininema proteolyticum TaxID=1607685 RepID=A0ABV8U4F2_9ACTN